MREFNYTIFQKLKMIEKVVLHHTEFRRCLLLNYRELELSGGYPESSSSELGVVEYRPLPLNSRGRSLFKMGGWSRSAPWGLRLDSSGEEMAEISRGWLMLFTC